MNVRDLQQLLQHEIFFESETDRHGVITVKSHDLDHRLNKLALILVKEIDAIKERLDNLE